MRDHGVIYTDRQPPPLLPGEKLDELSILVWPTWTNILESASRMNYGKPYAFEQNVKVLEIEMIDGKEIYLLGRYLEGACLQPGLKRLFRHDCRQIIRAVPKLW